MSPYFVIVDLSVNEYYGMAVMTRDHKTAIKGMIRQLCWNGYDFWFIRKAVWAIPFERIHNFELN